MFTTLAAETCVVPACSNVALGECAAGQVCVRWCGERVWASGGGLPLYSYASLPVAGGPPGIFTYLLWCVWKWPCPRPKNTHTAGAPGNVLCANHRFNGHGAKLAKRWDAHRRFGEIAVVAGSAGSSDAPSHACAGLTLTVSLLPGERPRILALGPAGSLARRNSGSALPAAQRHSRRPRLACRAECGRAALRGCARWAVV